jgi:cell division protein FtsB
MENSDAGQTSPRKHLTRSIPDDIAERVIQGNKTRLRTEIAFEHRRNILIQSQIDAIQARLNLQNQPMAASDCLPALEALIHEKKEIIAAKKSELFSLDDATFSPALLRSPTQIALDRQIMETNQRVMTLKNSLDDDGIEKDQEIIDLKARNLTLIQIKNGEINDLQSRRQKCASALDALMKQSDERKKAYIHSMEAIGDGISPIKKEFQALRRRQTELNLMIEQFQNGISEDNLAEASNSKLRNRLRTKLSHE